MRRCDSLGMMRVNRAGWLIGLAVLLAASANAAGAPPGVSHVTQPPHSDLIIMARTGIARWPHALSRTIVDTRTPLDKTERAIALITFSGSPYPDTQSASTCCCTP